MLDVGHAAVDVTDEGRAIQRGPDERVHVAGRIDLAHPVIAVRVDAESRERGDERLGMVAGVRGVAITGLVGDVRQRTAHLLLDGVGGQERLGVHRVEVVDAVEQRRLDPVRRAGPA